MSERRRSAESEVSASAATRRQRGRAFLGGTRAARRALQLARRGLKPDAPRTWAAAEQKPNYDVVILGATSSGLALAHHLAVRYPPTTVAVIDPGHLGSDLGVRPRAFLHRLRTDPVRAALAARSRELYEELMVDEAMPLAPVASGHVVLARDREGLIELRWRAGVARADGSDVRFIDGHELGSMLQMIEASASERPVLAAVHDAEAAAVGLDALPFELALGAAAAGADILEGTPLLEVRLDRGRVSGIVTGRGATSVPLVVDCTANGTVDELVGLAPMVAPRRVQSIVTEPVQPFLRTSIEADGVTIAQSERGEIVAGMVVDPYPARYRNPSLEAGARLAATMVDLLPPVARLRVARQWVSTVETTPDGGPLVGPTDVEGLHLNRAWGTDALDFLPATAEALASYLRSGLAPPLLAAYDPRRFGPTLKPSPMQTEVATR
ncbi:MAG: FAD-dependent oxidoreductase [Actinomycetota bacterium]|nr:FAD-dependent oxidoreductase [Actinomycetota bacterium]